MFLHPDDFLCTLFQCVERLRRHSAAPLHGAVACLLLHYLPFFEQLLSACFLARLAQDPSTSMWRASVLSRRPHGSLSPRAASHPRLPLLRHCRMRIHRTAKFARLIDTSELAPCRVLACVLAVNPGCWR